MKIKDLTNIETNGTVVNRLERYKLRCSFCRPHRGENVTYKKHGKKKPKYKNKRM